jgi:hypothetical protein
MAPRIGYRLVPKTVFSVYRRRTSVKKRNERMNRAELAARRGTTPQAMGQLLRRHGITAGSDGKFSPQEVDAILDGGADSPTSPGMTLSEATRRKEAALARLRELEYDLRSGKYCRSEVMADQITRFLTMLPDDSAYP